MTEVLFQVVRGMGKRWGERKRENVRVGEMEVRKEGMERETRY
jgi:hypothetical protein